MSKDALWLGDRREEALRKEIAHIYTEALKEALEKQKRFFKKIEDIESGKYKPPRFYVERGTVGKWRQGFVREALRQEQVIQNIMKVLNRAGGEAAALMTPYLADIYRYNREETVRLLSDQIEGGYGVVPNFAMYDPKQIKAILTDTQPPFSKIAYKNMGKNLIVRNRLQREFTKAILLGEGAVKMRKRVQKCTGQLIWQARRVARTERTRIQSQARYETAIEATEMGVGVYNEWVARMVNTRDTHAAMDGQKRMVGEPFNSPSGAQLLYPGDPSAPAEEVINCQCQITTRVLLPGERLVDDKVVKALPSGGDGGKIKWQEANFTKEKPLEWHWEKHKKEFPGYTMEGYLLKARNLLMQRLELGLLEEMTRSDGSISRYQFEENLFVATSNNGEIRTFMKPTAKEAYWLYEKERNK